MSLRTKVSDVKILTVKDHVQVHFKWIIVVIKLFLFH